MPQLNIDLSGQAAIITGAAVGIGEALALAFAQSGAAVALNDVNPDRVEDLAQRINDSGGRAIAFHGDISNRFQAAALIERARDTFGRIHILVNAAGVYRDDPILRIDEWDWRRQLDVNLNGAFFCVQLMSRVMAEEGGGSIVNIASTAGHNQPIQQGVAYTASKTGLIGLTKQAAQELAPMGIRVNAICPGNILEPDMPQPDSIANAMQASGNPEDVAALALFLCSDGARFITGQAINVDGGGNML